MIVSEVHCKREAVTANVQARTNQLLHHSVSPPAPPLDHLAINMSTVRVAYKGLKPRLVDLSAQRSGLIAVLTVSSYFYPSDQDVRLGRWITR